MAADFSQAAIYVGTYAKYNAGSLFGKWFDLSDFADKDEFWKRVRNSTRTRTTPNLCFKIEKTYPKNLFAKVGFQICFSSYGIKWKIWTQTSRKPFPLGLITRAGI